MGCLALFATPFAGVGVITGFIAVREMMANGLSGQFLFMTMFALVFGSAGFGLIYLAFIGGKEQKKIDALQAQHPDAPWMWRTDWAAGRIESGTKASIVMPWVFAIMWNLISAPVLVLVPPHVAENRAILLVFMFPVIGVFLLIGAIKQTVAAKKFGTSYLELASVPGVIGGKLRGVIQTRFSPTSESRARLMLTCFKSVTTGSGDDRSTSEHILWREERAFGPSEIGVGPIGASIPVDFDIPDDQPATNSNNSSDQIIWRVHATAELPGLDYAGQFDVPVFRTAATPATHQALPVKEGPPPKQSSIVIRTSAAGGREFVFPAARNPGVATIVTILLLIFGGATWFAAPHIPIFGTLIFGLFDLILLLIALSLWLGVERVIVERGTITTRNTILGLGRVHQIPCADVAELKLSVGMQTGGGSGTPYYDIQLVNRAGRRFKLGGELKDKHEADWIIVQIKKAAGL